MFPDMQKLIAMHKLSTWLSLIGEVGCGQVILTLHLAALDSKAKKVPHFGLFLTINFSLSKPFLHQKWMQTGSSQANMLKLCCSVTSWKGSMHSEDICRASEDYFGEATPTQEGTS